MCFGDMVDNGFQWLDPSWQDQVTNLAPEAIEFYTPYINKRILNHCFMLYPSMENLHHWQRALMNVIAEAVENQAPTLTMLSFKSLMPDREEGAQGVMNLQEDGTEGQRMVNFGTEYPQSMLKGDIADYGSDGSAKSKKITKYKPSIDAIKDFNDPKNPYQDAINRIVEEVYKSGVFSSFIY